MRVTLSFLLMAITAIISIIVLNISLYLISYASSVANCIGVIFPVIWASFVYFVIAPAIQRIFK